MFSCLFISCNSLFYYPQPKLYATPKNYHLKYDSFDISSGKETLKLWYLHAETQSPIATIIHFHGNAQNMSAHFFSLMWLVYFGFDVVEFDYRGYGASTGEPTREGLLEDGRTVLNWVNAHARNKELFVIAQSLGGAVAVPSLALTPLNDVNSLILDSTFASYREIARKKLAGFWLTWPFQWPMGFLVSDDASSLDFIKQIKVPLVFLHSKQDPVVPYESGVLLYETAPEPKEFWEVPWSGHVTAFNGPRQEMRKKLLSYLCQHLRKKNMTCDRQAENYADPWVELNTNVKPSQENW